MASQLGLRDYYGTGGFGLKYGQIYPKIPIHFNLILTIRLFITESPYNYYEIFTKINSFKASC